MDNTEYSLMCRNIVKKDDLFLINKIGLNENEQIKLNTNCDGYGRVRTFKKNKESDWLENPLPQAPFAKSLSLSEKDELNVQVFEIARCNLNCWWCFLPDEFRNCSSAHTKFYSSAELLNLYLRDASEVKVIDLTGGNPEIVPEWVLGFMNEIEKRGLQDEIYLWSDDVLTTDIFFKTLSQKQIDYMVQYKNYGKVACFKGFDEESFVFNTRVNQGIFKKQLEMAEMYIKTGFDIYFYISLTCPDLSNIELRISDFFDKLQRISYYLPLRIVPIKIKIFDTNQDRMLLKDRKNSLDNQYNVLTTWKEELEKRFSSTELKTNIANVPLML